MKVFLAGASGAIGRLLIPLLKDAGYDLAGTTRSQDRAETITQMGARSVLMNAPNRDSVFAALEQERPDVVIHQLTDLAGRDFAGNARLRIEGTRNLVDAAKAVGVEHMIAQSIAWIYAPGDGPAHENDPWDRQAASESRRNTVLATLALEEAVAEMPNHVVLRYGLFYGPGTWYTRESYMTEAMKKGEITATDAIVSFVHIHDAAQACVQALVERWPVGAYNIVDDAPASGRQWVPYYASLVGAPEPAIKPGREPWERGATNAKARQIGWMPMVPTWREGFKQELSGD